MNRECIRCGKHLPDGQFNDYWYAKTNVCKDCKYKAYRKSYLAKKQRKQNERIR